jgi:AcrR family transcriptional regulator
MPSPAKAAPDTPSPAPGPDPNPPWWPKRVAQRRSSRDPISHERVVETALSLWRTEGADALSMRRLAAALGVAPTAIYWWAGNKDQLLAYVVDEIFGRIALPAGDAATDWRDDIRAIARHTFDTMVDYAGIQPVLHAGVPSGPNTLRHLERWITVLLKAGFAPDEVPTLHAAFGREIMGCVAAAHGATGLEKDRWTMGFRLEELAEDAWPGLHRVGAAMREATPRADLAAAVELLIRGLDSLLAERRGGC